MPICPSCRMAIRQSMRQTRHMSTKPSPSDILSKPSWSIRSLLSSDQPDEIITPSQLHHLLRLSALPLPKSPAEERSMISTLQSQLRFVRAVQRVDTTGVEPLRAIRDETEAGMQEGTISLDTLKSVLDKEIKVGHYQRPKKVREKPESRQEEWDVMGTARRRAGRFFVVQSKKGKEEDGG